MGIPIDLVACVNANDVVARFLDHGDYSVDTDRPTISTWATAMDIQVWICKFLACTFKSEYNINLMVYQISIIFCDVDAVQRWTNSISSFQPWYYQSRFDYGEIRFYKGCWYPNWASWIRQRYDHWYFCSKNINKWPMLSSEKFLGYI